MNIKRYFSREILIKYTYNVLAGRFVGFIIGLWASGLVSRFFETRSFRNLWGFTARKKLVSKDTFENLEWISSVVIGFIVCEIVQKMFEDYIKEKAPVYYKKSLEYAERNGFKQKAIDLKKLTLDKAARQKNRVFEKVKTRFGK